MCPKGRRGQGVHGDGRSPLVRALDAHRPHVIEIVPGLSSIDGAAARPFQAMSFTATTPDTAAGTPQYKRQRWLVTCTNASRPEQFHLGERVFGFRCGEPVAGRLPRPEP